MRMMKKRNGKQSISLLIIDYISFLFIKREERGRGRRRRQQREELEELILLGLFCILFVN